VLVSEAEDGGRAALDRFATQTYGFPLDAVDQIQAGARHLVCRVGVLGPESFLHQLEQLAPVKEMLT
jgi:hypothetical protein